MSRPSDAITHMRQIAGQFTDTANKFEQYAKELTILQQAGKLSNDNFPSGHNDITLAELNATIQAIASILGNATDQEKANIILIRQ